MSQMKVSIIIPAYNTEDYIEHMLKCVERQTYKNLEIIIINDGSTDGTLQIIQNYVERDLRAICLNIPNGGVSHARNLGIEYATGKKIFFWDSDDDIELNCIEECVRFAEEEKVESVLYGYSDRVNGVNGKQHKSILRKIYVDGQIYSDLLPNFIGHSFEDINKWIRKERSMRETKELTALWRIMVDTKVIKENNLCFDINLSLGEDTKFICQYLMYSKTVGYLNKCFYHLTIRMTGANLTSYLNVKLMQRNKIKLIAARQELDKIAKNQGHDIHELWEGTLVFSAIQLILKSAKSKSGGGYSLVKEYICVSAVIDAIKGFRPALGIRAVPFYILKMGMSRGLYLLMRFLPAKIANVVAKEN